MTPTEVVEILAVEDDRDGGWWSIHYLLAVIRYEALAQVARKTESPPTPPRVLPTE